MKTEEKLKQEIEKRNKGICETCGNEGVCWLLSPCSDCKEGKRIKKIGEIITKNLKNNKIKSKTNKKNEKRTNPKRRN